MTNNFFPTIYAPIKVSERLPENDGSFFIDAKGGRGSVSFKNGEWDNGNPHLKFFKEEMTWLEPLTNRYVFTEDELEKAFVDFISNYTNGISEIENAKKFIKSH